MLKLSFLLVLLVGAITLPATAQSDFPYERYKQRTLAELIEEGSNLPAKTGDKASQRPTFIFDADFNYSRVRVRFMERSRPISSESKELLGFWQKSFSIEQKVIDLYQDEYLFKECDTEYWIPVQKQVSSYFPKELKPGDMITLFLLRATGKKSKDGKSYSFLFLSTEFDKSSM